VSLLLVGFSLLFYVNVSSMIRNVENKNEVIAFLNEDVTDETIDEIKGHLDSNNNVLESVFYSKEEAFADLKMEMSADYPTVFDALDSNPLPHAFKIKIDNIQLLTDTVKEIEMYYGVFSVRAPYEFADALIGLSRVMTVVSVSIIIALVVVCMVIVSNTTKASVFSRRKEINIMRYVGATNAFIRIPFFIEGLVIGVISGLVASAATWIAYDSFVRILVEEEEVLSIIGLTSLIDFSTIAAPVVSAYLLVGAFLGSAGSVLSMGKHLKA
jgi:cell division transport system permease protein